MLKLVSTDDKVTITIKDDGMGMREEVRHKILNNISVTEGKDSGSDIGYCQITDTIKDARADFSIDSTVGLGTEVSIRFAKHAVPQWFCLSITIIVNLKTNKPCYNVLLQMLG